MRIVLMALVIGLAFENGPAWADRRLDSCRAALEDNARQLKSSASRIKAINELQQRTAEKINLAGERLLKNPEGDSKANFVRDILHGFNDAHQAFHDLGAAWVDREVLLRNLGKRAVECVSRR